MPRFSANGLKRGPCQGGGKALFLTRPRVASPTPLVSACRCRCRAGNCAKHVAGCRPDGRTGTAARRSPNRRAGPCTDQAATDRSLAGVLGILHADKLSANANAIPPGSRNAFVMSSPAQQEIDPTTQGDWAGFPRGLVWGTAWAAAKRDLAAAVADRVSAERPKTPQVRIVAVSRGRREERGCAGSPALAPPLHRDEGPVLALRERAFGPPGYQ